MKYRASLYSKFLVGYAIFAILCFIFVNNFSSNMIADRLVVHKASEMYKQSANLVSYFRDLEKQADQNADEFLNTMLVRFQLYSEAAGSSIYYVDSAGNLVLSSEWQKLQEPVPTSFAPADFSNGNYIRGDYLHELTNNNDTITVYSSLPGNFKVSGYIVINTPMENVNPQVYYLQTILYITVMAILVLSLSLLLMFTIIVFRPLQSITNAANEYASGNFAYRPEVKSHDEMGYLAATLGYMANEIEEAGEGQRKLVANVSHDFRSPLTSIKGYLEAIEDGTIPPEMQNKYIHIVLDETERLRKLTQDLLSLNTIGTKGTLDMENFDINHSIRKIAASFEGTCQKKDISFELLFSGHDLEVYGDREKIDRVLYNLIDNAIKFSPDHDVIEIETYQKNDKAFISVKDNGIGIAKEDLNKIWNRFYKSDSSRGKDKKGTGLGLAIAKDIIQAHKESIDVVSTLGVGTKFTFRLPLAARK